MTPHTLETHSQLFTVRLWREDLGAGETEWRGQVTHVLSGDVRYFREWPELVELLRQFVQPGVATPRRHLVT